MKMKTVTFGVLIVLISGIAAADFGPPMLSCFKPSKPFQFNSENEVKSFYDDVDTYKSCINDFVKQQQRAVEAHKSAADTAINQWNMFVRMELNN